MRLLNTKTQRLSEFVDDSIPPYATLSHTWIADQEISLPQLKKIHELSDASVYFRPFQPPPSAHERHEIYRSRSELTNKWGYSKIMRCCELARKDGFEWAWIDTCCIDKTSSVELSEAINSMFLWYQNCGMCYTFLFDVPDGDALSDKNSKFRKSRWFTRGWTLQELLAPPHMKFLSKSWNILGDRHYLCEIVSQVTGIPSIYLEDNLPGSSSASFAQQTAQYSERLVAGEEHNRTSLSFASVVERMAWASGRSTTRKEDMAYCLLGIFGVNMPLLYGEGDKAFKRLQEQIIKETEDSGANSHQFFSSLPFDFTGRQQKIQTPDETENLKDELKKVKEESAAKNRTIKDLQDKLAQAQRNSTETIERADRDLRVGFNNLLEIFLLSPGKEHNNRARKIVNNVLQSKGIAVITEHKNISNLEIVSSRIKKDN